MLIKNIILACTLLVTTCQITFAQSFFKDYKTYLEVLKSKSHSTKYKASNTSKQLIERLNKMFDEVQVKENRSMLSSDTLYMVLWFFEPESPRTSILVWNKTNSCYYDYTFELQYWKVTNEKLQIETNASKAVNALRPEFKKWVEIADTSNYNTYGKAHPVYDGPGVRFTVANKLGNHWHFVSSKSYATIVN